MILFHEAETHYNLIVSNKSELALSGNLSYRYNIGPIIDEIEVGTGNENENENHSKHNEDAEHKGRGNVVKSRVNLKLNISDAKKS